MPPARLREFGLAGFLPKPFAVSTLIEIVERHHADTGGDGTDSADTPAPQGEIDAF
jgi:FixJ family two-component response regulator